ncbi:MAG: PAS domain-containing protein, partial [Spirulinaceae cyanobacterium]
MMWEIIRELFSPERFMPHGNCYLWQTQLVWLHVISDSLIALAYYSIPAMLIYFVRKREDVPFRGIFFLFGAFIIACGTTHILEVWTLWHPAYWLSGFLKALTAFISCYTALELFPLIPQALALTSPAQLEAINLKLEERVQQRTTELYNSHQELEREITERKQKEERLRVLERAITASNNGIVISDATQKELPIVYLNPAFERITGYSAQEVIGKNCRFLQGKETDQEALEELRGALREGKECNVVLRNYRKDGS